MTEKLTKELATELATELEVQLLIKMRKLIKEQLFFPTQLSDVDKEIQQILCYLNLPTYENTNNYLQLVEEQIKNKCQHNYVTDDIDIDPDKSMKICYCTICEKGL